MTKEARIWKRLQDSVASVRSFLNFGIRISFVIRHSVFGIRVAGSVTG